MNILNSHVLSNFSGGAISIPNLPAVPSQKAMPILAVCAGQTIWGFSYIFTKIAMGVASPDVLLSIRFILAFLLMNIMTVSYTHLDVYKRQPIGAFMAKDKLAEAFKPGDHASTFGGNPFATAAGTVVMDELLNGGLLDNVKKQGELLTKKLNELKAKHSKMCIRDRRDGVQM